MKLEIHCDTQNYVKACCKLQRAIQIIGVVNLHNFWLFSGSLKDTANG